MDLVGHGLGQLRIWFVVDLVGYGFGWLWFLVMVLVTIFSHSFG
jgi:hypothetical protein